MPFTYDANTNILNEDDKMIPGKNFNLADVLEKINRLDMVIQRAEGKKTQLLELVDVAKAGGYQEGDDVGEATEAAAFVNP